MFNLKLFLRIFFGRGIGFEKCDVIQFDHRGYLWTLYLCHFPVFATVAVKVISC